MDNPAGIFICVTARTATTGRLPGSRSENHSYQYQSTCRHGTAYTTIQSRFAGIASETTYFVPLGQKFEYWRHENHPTNPTSRGSFSAFTFCEIHQPVGDNQDRGQFAILAFSSCAAR